MSVFFPSLSFFFPSFPSFVFVYHFSSQASRASRAYRSTKWSARVFAFADLDSRMPSPPRSVIARYEATARATTRETRRIARDCTTFSVGAILSPRYVDGRCKYRRRRLRCAQPDILFSSESRESPLQRLHARLRLSVLSGRRRDESLRPMMPASGGRRESAKITMAARY